MSKSVWLLAPHEDWICDRLVGEFSSDNRDIVVKEADDADVIWLFSDWCWGAVSKQLLFTKKVLATIHHIVPDKFKPRDRLDFDYRDRFVNAYHVPNVHTAQFVRSLTTKPIHVIPYWANQRIWSRGTGLTRSESMIAARRQLGLPENSYIVGSFQRDTEGSDLQSPKLEKGPDLLCDALEAFAPQMRNLHVLLGGWRRQYVTRRLDQAGIPYTYLEKVSQSTLNTMYCAIDLYPVTSRYEGGPQALIECGLLDVPVVSRDIGMASALLPSTAINNEITQATPTVPNVEHLLLPSGYLPYRKVIEDL